MDDSIKVTVIDRQGSPHALVAPIDMGLNMMELCKSCDLPVKGTCGGMALCSTCHIYIESGHDLTPPSVDEEEMLDQAFFVKSNSRLGCQIRLKAELDGLVVRLAPEDEEL